MSLCRHPRFEIFFLIFLLFRNIQINGDEDNVSRTLFSLIDSLLSYCHKYLNESDQKMSQKIIIIIIIFTCIHTGGKKWREESRGVNDCTLNAIMKKT